MGFLDKAREKLFSAADGAETKEIEAAVDQPQADIDLCAFVKKQVDDVRMQATRISHEGIWMTNIAYLLGFDSVYYDPSMRQFRPLGQVSGSYVRRNRIHSNLILPAVQNRLARMIKAAPRYEVRPNSLTEEDKDAAKLGEDIIGAVWDAEHINRKRIDLGMWLQECGHSYIGVCWDDQKGERIPEDLCPEGGVHYQGGCRIDVVPAFEGFADPLAKTMDEAGWFARVKARKLDYFRTHYPERGNLVKEEGVWLLSTQYEMRINTLNTVGPASSGTAEQMKGAALEISYYEKRSQSYPNGRHVVSANGVLLKNGELPIGEIPYAKFDDVVIGGKFYSESLITHARPLQDQYNRTLVKRAEWVNKLLTGKYIAARGHGLHQESINDQSGEVVEYDPVPGAQEPHAMNIPNLPSYAYEESKEIKNDLNEIFSLSQVSRGQLPSASIPAMGIQLLLEQDETRMGVETEQHEHSWAKVGGFILRYEDKYAITSRTLKTKGREKNYDIRNYTGEDLRKNFDVTVIRGSTVPNSKVIHRQEIMNLFSEGLLGPPQEPAVRDKVLGMLQYGDVGEAWEDHHLDKMQVQRDMEEIEQDMAPPVDEKDNHILHMIDKNRYRKSDKFFSLTPLGQQILQDNIGAHAAFAVKQSNPALATPPQMPPPPLPAEITNISKEAAMVGPPGMPGPGVTPVA